MSLFPSIGVAGHSAEDGLNPDGGALQEVIGKNLFKELDRGAPFRRKLASVLERVRSPPVLLHMCRNTSGCSETRQVYQEMTGREEPFPMLKPENVYEFATTICGVEIMLRDPMRFD
eukprot:g116.t1